MANLVAVCRDVRRVLRDDGTLWLNLGDLYNSGTQFNHHQSGLHDANRYAEGESGKWAGHRPMIATLKPKDLCGIPWRVAFALQADGWWLRSDIIWSKPNPMPESVTDRPTKAHEYLFLLTKRVSYYYDADAIREPPSAGSFNRWGDDPFTKRRPDGQPTYTPIGGGNACGINPNGRNKRSVWHIATQPYAEAHFATFQKRSSSRASWPAVA